MVIKLPKKKHILRPHQRKALRYCENVRHPFLAMDMRLGKCLVAIRRIVRYKPIQPMLGHRVLIVSPSEALGSWEEELTREGENFVTLQGKKDRKEILEAFEHDWYLLNKEGFLWLPEIANQRWDVVIIDESFIRSPKAKVTRFFTRNFRSCPSRWLLTGTPNPESDLELFPQLQWLDGHAFGYNNFWDFRAANFEVKRYEWKPKQGTKKFIDEYFGKRAFVMRRKDAGINTEKVVLKRTLDLPDDIRRIYNKCECTFEMGNGKSTIWSPVKYIWLRQLCGGFLDGKVKWSGKIDALLSLLTGELSEASVVVWFNYNAELHEVAKRLRQLKISCASITGASSRDDREENRKAFQTGQYRVILCQELAVRMGADLSRADTCIYFSRNPSAITDAQTQDRIVSLNKSNELLYIYLVVKDSVDEDLHLAMSNKKLTSDLTLNAALTHYMKGRIYGRQENTHSDHRKKLLNRFQASRCD